MIKMIVTDLDNTLLTNDKKITNKTKEVIEKCENLGIRFIPATARILDMLEVLEVKDYFINNTVICANGSRIYEKKYQEIAHRGMSKAELDLFLPDLIKCFNDCTITVDIENCKYCNFDVSKVDPYAKNYKITDFSDLPNKIADRIIMGLKSRDQLEDLQKILPDYLYAHLIEKSNLCRILHKDVSKAEAIKFLAKRYNIKLDEIVVFGDDYNDIEMFELVENKIAVSNAINELKEIATDITKSNNEDGVAYWLEKNILNNNS